MFSLVKLHIAFKRAAFPCSSSIAAMKDRCISGLSTWIYNEPVTDLSLHLWSFFTGGDTPDVNSVVWIMDFNFVSFISRNLKQQHNIMLRQAVFSAYNASISLGQQKMVILVRPTESNPQPPALQSSAVLTELILPRVGFKTFPIWLAPTPQFLGNSTWRLH